MYNKDYKDWVEISAGIENIARIARVDFVTGLSKNHATRFGVRVGIDLGLFQ
jgi:hypothetical protein